MLQIMEYKKKIKHLNLEQKIGSNQIKVSRRTYNTNSGTKFKTLMLKSSLCDYGDAYILFKGTITIRTIIINLRHYQFNSCRNICDN